MTNRPSIPDNTPPDPVVDAAISALMHHEDPAGEKAHIEDSHLVDGILFRASRQNTATRNSATKGQTLRRLMPAAAAVILLAAGGGIAFRLAQREKPSTATSEQVSPLTVVRAGKQPTRLSLHAGVTALLAPESRVALDPENQADRSLTLLKGSALVSVTPGNPASPVIVHAPWGDVYVKGTVFRVIADGDDKGVEVLRGLVEVRFHGGGRVDVAQGYRSGIAASSPSPLSNHAMDRLTADDAALSAPEDKPVIAALPLTPAAGPDTVEAPAPPTTARPQPEQKPDLSVLLQQARTARKEGRSADAENAYLQAARLYPLDARGASARLSAASIQLNETGDPSAAMKNFDLYIASGDPTLLEEALLGKAEAARRLGMTALETATLRAFIQQFPQSLHRRRAVERLSQIGAASGETGE